jgi:Zn-dependent protease
MTLDSIFTLIIVIFSVIIHEISHGYAAYFFGDQTVKYQGRLTLNPLKHIDIFGSIILPLLLIISNSGILFGWAKPVPYNPYNLRNRRVAEPLIALAGPTSNILLALLFSLVLRLMVVFNYANPDFTKMILTIVFTNIVLGLFNLIPIPPLDGSRILSSLLPDFVRRFFNNIEWYGMVIVLFFIVIFGQQLGQLATSVARLFIGM